MELEFKNQIVAFIDVLGFKNILENKDTEKLQKYLSFVTEEIKVSYEDYNIDYLLISDSIVIYTDYDERHLGNIIHTIALLQSKLLCYKILLRGAISSGLLYTNKVKNIIVGQGLINAYLLEQKAISPRIIIDRDFLKYDSFKRTFFKTKNVRWVDMSEYESLSSGFIFVNYFFTLVSYQQFLLNNRLEEVYHLLRENIYSNINFEKYNWIRVQFVTALLDRLSFLEKELLNPVVNKKKRNKELRIISNILQEVTAL